MKIKRLTVIALTCLSLLLTTRNAMAQVYPVIAYAQVTGQQQGYFTGSSRTPGFEGQIALVQVNVAVPTSGFSKFADASGPQFKTALSNNETLTIVIQMVKNKPGQVVPKAYRTYTLKNVHVQAIDPLGAVELINFSVGDFITNNN